MERSGSPDMSSTAGTSSDGEASSRAASFAHDSSKLQEEEVNVEAEEDSVVEMSATPPRMEVKLKREADGGNGGEEREC